MLVSTSPMHCFALILFFLFRAAAPVEGVCEKDSIFFYYLQVSSVCTHTIDLHKVSTLGESCKCISPCLYQKSATGSLSLPSCGCAHMLGCGLQNLPKVGHEAISSEGPWWMALQGPSECLGAEAKDSSSPLEGPEVSEALN